MRALPSLKLWTGRSSPPPALTRRVLLAIYALLIIGLGTSFVKRQHSDWDAVFVPTSAHLLAGNDIYHQPHGYTYPPFQSLFAVPVAHAPNWLSRLYWFTINVLCLNWALYSCWRFGGYPPQSRLGHEDDPRSGRMLWVVAATLLVALPFCFNSLSHQQSDLILLALLMYGCERLGQKHAIRASIGFGLAAAMKCTPLLFAPYLLVRGRVLAGCVLVVVALGASLLPDLIHQPTQHASWLSQWYEMYFAPMTRPDYTPGVWASEVIYNQSFIGATNRWTHTRRAVENGKVQIQSIPPVFSPSQLKSMILGLVLVCGTLGLVAVWSPVSTNEPDRTAWECSIVIAGMLLFSPMSSPAHFGLLLLPAAMLARGMIFHCQYRLTLPAALLLLGALAINKDLLGARLYTLGLWYGVAMWAAVGAMIGAFLGRIANQDHTVERPQDATALVHARKAA